MQYRSLQCVVFLNSINYIEKTRNSNRTSNRISIFLKDFSEHPGKSAFQNVSYRSRTHRGITSLSLPLKVKSAKHSGLPALPSIDNPQQGVFALQRSSSLSNPPPPCLLPLPASCNIKTRPRTVSPNIRTTVISIYRTSLFSRSS